MAAPKHNPRTRAEQKFWDTVFTGAEVSHFLKGGANRNPAGAAHLAREYADAALIERRRSQGGVP